MEVVHPDSLVVEQIQVVEHILVEVHILVGVHILVEVDIPAELDILVVLDTLAVLGKQQVELDRLVDLLPSQQAKGHHFQLCHYPLGRKGHSFC